MFGTGEIACVVSSSVNGGFGQKPMERLGFTKQTKSGLSMGFKPYRIPSGLSSLPVVYLTIKYIVSVATYSQMPLL